MVRGRPGWTQQVRQMYHNGSQIAQGIPGESVWIELDQLAVRGDQIYLLDDITDVPPPIGPKPPDNGPDDNGPDDDGPEDNGPDDNGPDDDGPEDDGPDDNGPDDDGPNGPKPPKPPGPKPDLPDPNRFPPGPDETKEKGGGSGG